MGERGGRWHAADAVGESYNTVNIVGGCKNICLLILLHSDMSDMGDMLSSKQLQSARRALGVEHHSEEKRRDVGP